MIGMFQSEALTTMNYARFEMMTVLHKIQLFCYITQCWLLDRSKGEVHRRTGHEGQDGE